MYMFYRMAGVRIILSEEAIVYKHRSGERVIRFDDVTSIKFGSMMTVLGVIKIRSDDGSIRVCALFDKMHDFLVEFKEALDKKGLAAAYDEKRLHNIMKMAAYSDQGWAWFRKSVPKLALSSFIAAMIGYCFSRVGRFEGAYVFLWVVASAFWPWTIYAILDLNFMLRVRRQSAEDCLSFARQYVRQKEVVYQKGFILGAAAYLVLATGLLAVRLTDHQAFWKMHMDEGQILHEEGRFVEAEAKFSLAVERAEKVPLEEHAVKYALIWLGDTYKRQEKYSDAEASLKKAIAISEKNPRPDRWYIATASGNLARIYEEQEKYDQAEELFSQALAIREEAHGPDRSDTVRSILDLAYIYRVQEKYEDAEEQYKRAMTIGKKIFKNDDLRLANVVGGMAGLYREQARYDEAEPLYMQALAIREQELGPDHACVVSTVEKYAEVLRGMGRDAEAEELEARVESAGAEHREE